jgi:hypothetical protein
MKTEHDLPPNEALNKTVVMRWISCDERLPLCYSTGNWDGKKSDNFIGETMTGKQFIGNCYEGEMDGNKFFDWYQIDEINNNDWSINEVISRWFPIPL